ncbi:hypothetical protein ACFX15_041100 [Malus domestica]|uniref:Uncharacterized protein n=1 Tax=Malus domestica TaxID=3750 RepID=A0A498JGI2_MALDO|nr:hypothetical protein DVH24_024643 [Malus domestica]
MPPVLLHLDGRCIVMIFQSGGTSGKLKMRVGKKGPKIDIDVEFTYSVNWKATSTQFQNRMDKYSKASLLPVR